MTVESVTYISDLNASYPAAGDSRSEGDDHIRNLKTGIKATFPNVSGAVTPTHTELNYVDGVTSAIQTQLDGKQTASGPAFSAYQSSAHSFAEGVEAKVALQSEEFDTANAFDSATNYIFQPAVAGYYQLDGAVAFSASTTLVTASIAKNGTVFKRGGDGVLRANVSALVYLNGSTDFVDLRAQQFSGGSANSSNSAENTYFQGFLARQA
jgi:hypothetical protein